MPPGLLGTSRLECNVVTADSGYLLQNIERRAKGSFTALDVADTHLVPIESRSQLRLRQAFCQPHLAHVPPGPRCRTRYADLFFDSWMLCFNFRKQELSRLAFFPA